MTPEQRERLREVPGCPWVVGWPMIWIARTIRHRRAIDHAAKCDDCLAILVAAIREPIEREAKEFEEGCVLVGAATIAASLGVAMGRASITKMTCDWIMAAGAQQFGDCVTDGRYQAMLGALKSELADARANPERTSTQERDTVWACVADALAQMRAMPDHPVADPTKDPWELLPDDLRVLMLDWADAEIRYVDRGDPYSQKLDAAARTALASALLPLLRDRERLDEWAKLLVEMALPYEAIRADDGSRKWIAPEIRKHIVEATEAARRFAREYNAEAKHV